MEWFVVFRIFALIAVRRQIRLIGATYTTTLSCSVLLVRQRMTAQTISLYESNYNYNCVIFGFIAVIIANFLFVQQ